MMTVEKRKEAPKRTTTFENLPIGEVYRDEEGYITIKVSDNEDDNCLTLGWISENVWAVTSENRNTEVTPLKATLTVWEEEE